MNLGHRAFAFGVGAAIAFVIGGFFVPIFGTEYSPLEALPSLVMVAFVVGLLSVSTVWVGFGIALKYGRTPLLKYCATLGALFASISMSAILALDKTVLHTFGTYIVGALFLFVAPTIALVGSLLSKQA